MASCATGLWRGGGLSKERIRQLAAAAFAEPRKRLEVAAREVQHSLP
jgi:hypothetical protein